MKWLLLPTLAVSLAGCSLFQRYPRPPRAPPEEAAQVRFPLELPAEGRQHLTGVMARAIQLADDDFRPLGAKPHRGADPLEACLYRRESFDVVAAPGPEGVVFVSFAFNAEACPPGGPIADAGATYAIDTKQWRILAVQ